MDVTSGRRVLLLIVAFLCWVAVVPAARAAQEELVGFSTGPYTFKAVATDGLPGFQDPGFVPAGWGTGTAPFGKLTSCGGLTPPTQTGGWTNNSDLLLRRSFEAPAGVGAGSVQVRVDNDVTVYVNGAELATAEHEGCAGAGPPGPITIPAGTLHAGTNLLALRAVDRTDQRYIDARVAADVDRFAVSLNPASIPAGARRTLTATIRNLGSATLQSVTLTPPSGLTGGGTLSGLGLAPGATATRSFDVVAACGAAGGGWTATASAPGTTPALSASDSTLGTAVTGACSAQFATQPANARIGQAITDTAFTPGAGPVVVEVLDATGARAAGAGQVTVTRDPGSPGIGTLTGGDARATADGAAAFAALKLDAAGAYRLVATSPGATGATSAPLMIEQAARPCTAASCTASVASPVTQATVDVHAARRRPGVREHLAQRRPGRRLRRLRGVQPGLGHRRRHEHRRQDRDVQHQLQDARSPAGRRTASRSCRAASARPTRSRRATAVLTTSSFDGERRRRARDLVHGAAARVQDPLDHQRAAVRQGAPAAAGRDQRREPRSPAATATRGCADSSGGPSAPPDRRRRQPHDVQALEQLVALAPPRGAPPRRSRRRGRRARGAPAATS